MTLSRNKREGWYAGHSQRHVRQKWQNPCYKGKPNHACASLALHYFTINRDVLIQRWNEHYKVDLKTDPSNERSTIKYILFEAEYPEIVKD